MPLVVKPGAYEQVATDLRRAVVDAGLEVESRPASAAMSKPAKWIAAVGGRSSSSLVPDRMLQLRGKDIDILIYPMDLLISGKPELLARARAAMASRMTTTAAHLTVSAESQAIEDRLTKLATASATPPERPRFDDDAAAAFEAIDGSLATLVVPYDEREVLYRQRLQVERDLRAGAMAGEAIIGTATPGAEGIQTAAAKASAKAPTSSWMRPPTNARRRRSTGWRGPRSVFGSSSRRWRPARSASSCAVAPPETDAAGRTIGAAGELPDEIT